MRRASGRWYAALALVVSLVAPSARGATLKGTVTDATGAPVAGARVDIASAAPMVGLGIFCPTCYIDCAKATKTDAEGQFEIRGLNDSLRFRVLSSASGKLTQVTDLIVPETTRLEVTLEDLPSDVPADRIVRGVVRSETKTPIEGALVSAAGAEQKGRRWWGRVDVASVVTDQDGAFAMFLPEGMSGVDLDIEADGFAGASVPLVKAGGDVAEIAVPTGAKVTGTLVDENGPRPKAQAAVVQIERTMETHFIKAVLATSDADGKFTLEVLPPDQDYVVFSPVGEGGGDGWVVSTRRFHVGASGTTRDVGELKLAPGLTFRGRLEAPEGMELPRGVKLSLGRNPAWDLIELPVDAEGRFEAAGLPSESYTVRISTPGWELDPRALEHQQLSPESFGVRLFESKDDLALKLRPSTAKSAAPRHQENQKSNDDETLATAGLAEVEAGSGVTLTGCVTRGGRPEEGVRLTVYHGQPEGDGVRMDRGGDAVTDANGRYVFSGLAEGDQYNIELKTSDGAKDPDWTYQSPWAPSVNQADGVVNLPPVRLMSMNQRLAGVVVDPFGQPVADVQVSVRAANGDFLMGVRGEVTDAEGRFAISNLPDMALELFAYVANPEGGSIAFPAVAPAERGQQDIRIMLDPRLTASVPEL